MTSPAQVKGFMPELRKAIPVIEVRRGEIVDLTGSIGIFHVECQQLQAIITHAPHIFSAFSIAHLQTRQT